jgi:hypothetical protein
VADGIFNLLFWRGRADEKSPAPYCTKGPALTSGASQRKRKALG